MNGFRRQVVAILNSRRERTLGDPFSADVHLVQGWWSVDLRLKHPTVPGFVERGTGLVGGNPIVASENKSDSEYVMGGRAQSMDRVIFKVVLREIWMLGAKATK